MLPVVLQLVRHVRELRVELIVLLVLCLMQVRICCHNFDTSWVILSGDIVSRKSKPVKIRST